WGLYQVHGNVWEWTEDCYHDGGYLDVPSDGASQTNGDCNRRVLRGGALGSPPTLLRAASRLSGSLDERHKNKGPRVARALNSAVSTKLKWISRRGYNHPGYLHYYTIHSRDQCEKLCIEDSRCVSAHFGGSLAAWCHLYDSRGEATNWDAQSEIGVK